MVDPVVEQRRADYMEWLYEQSGRTNCIYTGLFEERRRYLLERDMREVLDSEAR
jgi:hypothetical protein